VIVGPPADLLLLAGNRVLCRILGPGCMIGLLRGWQFLLAWHRRLLDGWLRRENRSQRHGLDSYLKGLMEIKARQRENGEIAPGEMVA
jgi:hypothetical protein